MIAKTIYLASPAATSGDLAASDIVAICSLGVATLALGFSIINAEIQRRHNIRVARPHLDVMNLTSAILSVVNHGPGVARLISFKGMTDDRTFNFLSEQGLTEYCEWLQLASGPVPGGIDILVLPRGSYLAPNSTRDLIRINFEPDDARMPLIEQKVSSVAFELSYSSIYEKVYNDYHEPHQLPTP